jgi:hypothetical protein
MVTRHGANVTALGFWSRRNLRSARHFYRAGSVFGVLRAGVLGFSSRAHTFLCFVSLGVCAVPGACGGTAGNQAESGAAGTSAAGGGSTVLGGGTHAHCEGTCKVQPASSPVVFNSTHQVGRGAWPILVRQVTNVCLRATKGRFGPALMLIGMEHSKSRLRPPLLFLTAYVSCHGQIGAGHGRASS